MKRSLTDETAFELTFETGGNILKVIDRQMQNGLARETLQIIK